MNSAGASDCTSSRQSGAVVRQAAVAKRRKRPRRKRASGVGGGRRKKTVVVAPTERQYTCFLGEDGGLQLCRLDGQGEAIALTAPDALGIAAFVERHRSALSS